MIDSIITLALLTLVTTGHIRFQHSFLQVDHLRKQVVQVRHETIMNVCELAKTNQAYLSIMHHRKLSNPCTTKTKQYRRRYWKIQGSLFFMPNQFLSIPIHLWVAPS